MTRYICAWLVVLSTLLAATAARAGQFASDFQGKRIWTGPQYWASAVEDWRVEGGRAIALAADQRALSLLTCELGDAGSFTVSVRLQLDGKPAAPQNVVGGFRFGASHRVADYRCDAVLGRGGVIVGVHGDGRLAIGEKVTDEAIDISQPTDLRFDYDAATGTGRLTAVCGQKKLELSDKIDGAKLKGLVSLVAYAPRKNPRAQNQARLEWAFADWRLSGERVQEHSDRAFGPILWTTYTLSRGVMKMTTQMPPIGADDAQTVALEIRDGESWKRIAEAPIDPLSRTAIFRIADWPVQKDVQYRAVYAWNGQPTSWGGTVRHDPVEKPQVVLAAMSCDWGYAFPLPKMVAAIQAQDPDILFFAGDQIYEFYGVPPVVRSPLDVAMVNYLRKYYQFGWTWRQLLKDRPAIIIPDDHDVFHGNLWGAGGRALRPGEPQDAGGYYMPPDWVNAIERTQTGSLPDAVDPAPIEQGIGVYFTDVLYGRISFAVIEDRKFKSGPDQVFKPRGIDPDKLHDNPAALDLPEAQLLGERQMAFLGRWVGQWQGADFKTMLSQTNFCKAYTHYGPGLQEGHYDFDTNGWPQSRRNAALDVLRRGMAFMVHGDQHLGTLVHHGVGPGWDDGPISMLVPGTCNGYPRAWFPGTPGEYRKPGSPEWTGRYVDPFGNHINMLAVANLERESLGTDYATGEDQALHRGSGWALVRYDKSALSATFELYRYPGADAAPVMFDGFPQTIASRDNFAFEPAGTLPELRPAGTSDWTLSLRDDAGKLVYALRVKAPGYAAAVPVDGVYRAEITTDDGRHAVVEGLRPSKEPAAPVEVPLAAP